MQTKKMSLGNIQGKFSRVEMKNIMAGTGGSGCVTTGTSCNHNDKCCSGKSCPSQEDAKCPA